MRHEIRQPQDLYTEGGLVSGLALLYGSLIFNPDRDADAGAGMGLAFV